MAYKQFNWPVKALSAREVVKKTLKKGKNEIFHAGLRHMGETHSKKIISMVDDIHGDPNKIFFCELYIGSKVMSNLSKKPMSKIKTKFGRVHINL